MLRRCIDVAFILFSSGLVIVSVVMWRRNVLTRRQAVAAVVADTRAKLEEARQRAVVKMVAARTRESGVKERFGRVVRITDAVERRRQLLGLYREVMNGRAGSASDRDT